MGAQTQRASYERQKANTKKKASELSVLCGSPVGLIVHRIEADGTATFDTWPPDRPSVLSAIETYRQRQASEVVWPAKRQRTTTSSSSPAHHRPSLRPASSEDHIISRQWLPRLLSLSEEQRDHLGGDLGEKIEAASQTIHLMKRKRVDRDAAEPDERQELASVTSLLPSNPGDMDVVNQVLDSDLDDQDGLLSSLLAIDWDHLPTMEELMSDDVILNDDQLVPLSVVDVGDQQLEQASSMASSSSTSAATASDSTYLEASAVDHKSAAEQFIIDSFASSNFSGGDFLEYGLPADAMISSYFSTVPEANDYMYGFQEMGEFDQAFASYYG